MTTILFSFGLAFILSLILTPLARCAGKYLGIMDQPGGRKVHTQPIPRTGGAAIFLAFALALAGVSLLSSKAAGLLKIDPQSICLICGGLICFAIGIADDIRSLPANLKLVLQILAVSVAYAGGTNIGRLAIGSYVFQFGVLSYCLTVFWFLLFINAVNLVDGLDGLAGDVCFFASSLMVVLTIMGDRIDSAILFAALAGGILGFLKYNFNPASIFLGDGGSYFIGYAIAGMSIAGSVKSQMGTAILIPLIALGLPVFDTVLSSLRRFVVGKAIFGADKDHIHHKLIKMGLNTRNAVLIFYGMSVGLCLISLFIVNIRDEKAGVLLVVVGVGAMMLTRRLGYFDFVNPHRVVRWIQDVTDETGISRERRSFLDKQISISKSKVMPELWNNISKALETLEFDQGMLYLEPKYGTEGVEQQCILYSNGSNRRITPVDMASICLRQSPPEYRWVGKSFETADFVCSRCLCRIELPLESLSLKRKLGTLVLIKDNRVGPISHYSLKRVEHLRRAIMGAMERMGGGLRTERIRTED